MDKTANTINQFARFIGLNNRGLAPRPPWNLQPREIDLHSLEYDFPKIANKTPEKTLLPAKNKSQLSANSSELTNKINASGFPSASKPAYLSVDCLSASPDAPEGKDGKTADGKTEHLTVKKPSIKQYQPKEAKERKGNIVRIAQAEECDTQLPVGQGQLRIKTALAMSASTVAMPSKSINQRSATALLNQEQAKALLPELYGRNQFANDAARGNLDKVNLFIAAYPEADAGPSEYSPSPLIEAARNGHIDVVKALIPRASEKVQLDALCEVFRIATSTEKKQALEPVIHTLAQGFKNRDKNDYLNTITENVPDEHFDWVFDTIIKEWT